MCFSDVVVSLLFNTPDHSLPFHVVFLVLPPALPLAPQLAVIAN